MFGSIAVVAITFIATYAYAAFRKYPDTVRGVFSQGAFRGNIAYVGLALVFNALGQAGLTRAGILMGFLVPFLNLYAIIALLWPHRQAQSDKGVTYLVRQIALNPLIIASFAGIAWRNNFV